MLDFNSASTLSEKIGALIDAGLHLQHDRQPHRTYLGASRLGVACERALQYEYAGAPVDPGRQFSGQLLRIFERGHVIEDCMENWLKAAGFDVRTQDRDGNQFGFSVANGRVQGHIDGVIAGGPHDLSYPALWETKCLNTQSFRDLEKRKLALSKPIYAAQIAIYQAYLQLHEHPALFTAVNADTMEIYVEKVPFDAALAQRMSDRALRILQASDAGELLPRIAHDPAHFECRFCHWQERCWKRMSA